ncbi:hypothetical protein HLK56_22575 [Streptomyces sp. G9]|uniref:hypothetical protein n=1 Tax=Streptomyces sp. G9 TaxID=1684483 RepID=UPI003D734DAF
MFALVWGTFATTLGWVVAADFRGAAHRFHAFSHAATPFVGSGAHVMGVGFFRLVAGLFALIGPIVLVTGLLELWRGETENFSLPPVGGWFVLVQAVILGAALWSFWVQAVILGAALWSFWRRSGFLRRQWDVGSGPRRAAVAGVTASTVAFTLLLALGSGTWMLAAWLLGGLCGIALLLSDPADSATDV